MSDEERIGLFVRTMLFCCGVILVTAGISDSVIGLMVFGVALMGPSTVVVVERLAGKLPAMTAQFDGKEDVVAGIVKAHVENPDSYVEDLEYELDLALGLREPPPRGSGLKVTDLSEAMLLRKKRKPVGLACPICNAPGVEVIGHSKFVCRNCRGGPVRVRVDSPWGKFMTEKVER